MAPRYTAGPMTRSGSQVTISGKMHSSTIPASITSTYGSEPHNTSLVGTCGAIELSTNKFRPMGGVIRPISILMVSTTANQYGSKPAWTTMGYSSGAAMTITATGGRNMPATSRKTLIMPISTQRLTSSAAMACATLWVMNIDDRAKANNSAEAMIIMIITLSRMAELKMPV